MMESFLMYPYNWVILIVGMVLVIGAFVYLSRSKNRKGNSDQEEASGKNRDIDS